VSEGQPLTPEEIASMRPYEQQQGGWWEYGTDPHGKDKVWRPAKESQ
jgi:hypothetical protein